ncbi:putative SNF2 family helicase/ATPase PasG [Powellomyces hirtus]|nr:putative SNF2 family helicase/ATPase PasG [Powellomyces hirtus]
MLGAVSEVVTSQTLVEEAPEHPGQELDLVKAQHRARLSILLQKASCFCSFIADNLEQRQSELRQCVNVSDPSLGLGIEVQAVTVVKEKEDTAAETEKENHEEWEPEPPVKVMLRKRTRPKKGDGQDERSKRAKRADTSAKISSRKTKAIYKPPPPESIPPPRTSRQPSLITGGTLREYQLVGMEWLISLYENGLNGILADEMGLGKTIQVIAFLAHLWEVGTRGPFLIVVPLSTLVNWVTEIQRFAPSLPVLLYHGSKEEREYMRRHKMNITQPNFPIIVTTYEISMRDSAHLQMYAWQYIIVDEGHRLKNLDCKLIRELKTYRTANRLLLTGTPIQNNLSELWSLLNFVQPEMFSDRAAFEQCFDFGEDVTALASASTQKEILERQLETEFVTQLHEILKPFLLRRVKTEVELTLPTKREYVLYAPLTPLQKQLYHAAVTGSLRDTVMEILMGQNNLVDAPVETAKRTVRKDYTEIEFDDEFRVLDDLESDDENFDGEACESDEEAVPVVSDTQAKEAKRKAVDIALKTQNLQSPIVQLRKICNHPYLFNLGELPGIVTASGKMLVLERLLPKLFERGHRVLVFSQMTRVLDIIGEWCSDVKGWDYCRLDGSVGVHERRDEISRFEKTPTIPLFLLTTRAGGLGINLVSADTVIIFDSDWNPQMDLQAQDRVHRIGQTRSVVVYRLISRGTVEERVMGMAEGKRKLGEVIVHRGLFKGRHSDYKSTQKIRDEELAAILSAECEAASGFAEAGRSSNGDWTGVLGDDDELERVLRRDGGQDEASEAFKVVV